MNKGGYKFPKGNKVRLGISPWNKGIKTGIIPINAFKSLDVLREKNNKWVGDSITKQGGRLRAKYWFKIKPCEICGSVYWIHRHHIDENPKNNNKENIQFLCPKHHRRLHLGLAMD